MHRTCCVHDWWRSSGGKRCEREPPGQRRRPAHAMSTKQDRSAWKPGCAQAHARTRAHLGARGELAHRHGAGFIGKLRRPREKAVHLSVHSLQGCGPRCRSLPKPHTHRPTPPHPINDHARHHAHAPITHSCYNHMRKGQQSSVGTRCYPPHPLPREGSLAILGSLQTPWAQKA
jgi:hypothetical protein